MLSIGCAMIGSISLCVYLQWQRDMTYNWIVLLLMAVAAFCTKLWFEHPNKKNKRFGFAAGLLFVLLQILGNRITHIDTIAQKGSDFFWLSAAVLGLTPAVGGVFVAFVRLLGETRSSVSLAFCRKGSWRAFAVSFVILLACWLPYLLAFYPGLFTYDISWQYEQYQTWNLNTHHPLLHTLLVGWFADLGWHLFGYPSKGILMYTLFQMLLMAFSMASAIRLLYRYHVPLWCCGTVLLLNAVMPYNTLLVVSSTKDTLFAGSVLYLLVVLLELFLEKESLLKFNWIIRFVLAMILVGLLRNNGFICLIAVLAVAVSGVVHWKRYAVRLTAFAMAGIVLYGSANVMLKTATEAEDGHYREMLSVPLQQMARVYTLTDDPAKQEIAKWLPTVELYSPQLADCVKNTFDAPKEQLPEVFRLWLKTGLRNPIVYIDSFLITGAGFYYINARPTGQYLETKFHTDEGRWIVDGSKWPEFRMMLARLYSNNEFLDIPVFNILLSPALWVWVMIFSLAAAWCIGNRPLLMSGVVLFALYLTTLLSPCVMARYVYPFMLCAPLLAAGLLMKPREMNKTESRVSE